jgi:hypothetical protein
MSILKINKRRSVKDVSWKSSHMQDRKFVKAAKSMDATVTVLEVGVPVDFFLYQDGRTIKKRRGVLKRYFSMP